MKSLSERLLNDPENSTLIWWRLEEIEAEMPVPFCCPRAAGVRVVSPGHLRPDEADGPPVWLAMAPSRHFSTKPSAVMNCPFCGSALPRLAPKSRDRVPSPLVSPDGGHCDTCHERHIRCRCFPLITAWEAENAPPVLAAVCLVTRTIQRPGRVPAVRFLSVSRKGRPAEKGLPGGKVEPGEGAEAAARRELLEETGVVAGPMHKAFDAVDDAGVRVVVFRVESFTGDAADRQGPETGTVEWVSMSDLVESSPFSAFNDSLFSLLGIRC